MTLAFPFVSARLTDLLLAGALLLSAPLAALYSSPAWAQAEPDFYDNQPYAPGQWDIGRQLNQSEFRYCVDPRDPSWQVSTLR